MKIYLRAEHAGFLTERTWRVRSDVLARALLESIFRLAPDTMVNFWETDDGVDLLTRKPLPTELYYPAQESR